MKLLDHLTHGARHMPISGSLLRLMTWAVCLAVAFLTDTTWLSILAGGAAAGTAFISGLEMHEAATACENTTDDDGETGFGEAA